MEEIKNDKSAIDHNLIVADKKIRIAKRWDIKIRMIDNESVVMEPFDIPFQNAINNLLNDRQRLAKNYFDTLDQEIKKSILETFVYNTEQIRLLLGF